MGRNTEQLFPIHSLCVSCDFISLFYHLSVLHLEELYAISDMEGVFVPLFITFFLYSLINVLLTFVISR